MTDEWDDMDKAEVEPYWLNLRDDGGHNLELEEEVVTEKDKPFFGVVTAVDDNVGPNNSRLYTLRRETLPRPVKMWGSGHLDNQFQNAGLGIGDKIGVRKTGDTFETENGEAHEYDLRFSRQ